MLTSSTAQTDCAPFGVKCGMAHEHISAGAVTDQLLREIKQQLQLLRFGSLEISVHNGQVVQLERREKKRWGKGEPP